MFGKMKIIIAIVLTVFSYACKNNDSTLPVCFDLDENKSFFLGQKKADIEKNFSPLEKAYFYSGKLNAYTYLYRIEKKGKNVKTSFYFFFDKNKLCGANVNYEFSVTDTSTLNWTKRKAGQCYGIVESSGDTSWHYQNERIIAHITLDTDKLNKQIYSIWYSIAFREYWNIIQGN